MSGAYVAWRLMTGQAERGGAAVRLRAARPRGQLKVGLLEASDRIGGRLHSITRPEAPDLHAELGGMRFLQTQESVAGLARRLGLEIVDFPMGGPANRHYLRGSNLTAGDYEGRPDRRTLVRLFGANLVVVFTNASLALVAVSVLWVSPGAGWLLVIVAVILFLGYRSYARLQRKHDDLELLYDFTRRTGTALQVDSAMKEPLTPICPG